MVKRERKKIGRKELAVTFARTAMDALSVDRLEVFTKDGETPEWVPNRELLKDMLFGFAYGLTFAETALEADGKADISDPGKNVSDFIRRVIERAKLKGGQTSEK